MRAEPTGGTGKTTGRDEVRGRLGRRRDDSRDPEILSAALAVLTETGYERMTMDAVAARAKAGKATMYRRWPSKAELVVDAITSSAPMSAPSAIPDTGSLRGDLLALVGADSEEENARKLGVMVGLVAALPHHADLAGIVQEQLVTPRAHLVRTVLERAVGRGEIAAGRDLDTLALVGPAMTTYQLMIKNKPISQDFLVTLIDEVLLPMTMGRATAQGGGPASPHLEPPA
jgi:AcrR family transcriptional regulator